MSLSYKEVAEIIKIIDASSCEEVVLELEDMRLVVRRGGKSSDDEVTAPKTESATPVMQKQTPSSSSTAGAEMTLPDIDTNSTTLRSPMVGTFYARPSPDEVPFVQKGSEVTAGDPVCLIEVMKLYTTIEATAHGVVESILVEEGKLVEFDQPLFIIRNSDQ